MEKNIIATYWQKRIYRCLTFSFVFHIFVIILLLFIILSSSKEETIETITVDFAREEPQEEPEKNPAKQSSSSAKPEELPVPVPMEKNESTDNIEEKQLIDSKFLEEASKQDVPEPNTETTDMDFLAKENERILKNLEKRKKTRVTTIAGFNPNILKENRKEGRANLLSKGGGGKVTESSVHAGLSWLKRHQNKDGRWDSDNFILCCKDKTCTDVGPTWADPAVTGLAVLAFLGAGNTHKEGSYATCVDQGLKYLLESQQPDGCFGVKTDQYMYNHSIATLAMAEATIFCGETSFRQSATKALDFLIGAQNPGSGWRYTYRCGQADTSVTGWCLLALKACMTAELDVGIDSIQDAKKWLNFVTMKGEMPWVGYTSPQNSFCMTAVGVLCRILFLEEYDRPFILGGSQILNQSRPIWAYRNDYYYWYYGTMSMYQVGGKEWEQWNYDLKKALLSNQSATGCSKGSWGQGKHAGGRIYWTSMNILSLEVYYRYPKVFVRNLDKDK